MRRALCAIFYALTLAFWATPAAIAQSSSYVPVTDTTVVPGERVGPITSYSSLAILRAMYGRANVRPKMQLLPRGDTAPGARLFAGTDRQLDLLWEEGAREKRISEIRVIGKAWTLENGVKIGLTLPEVEKINGLGFKVNGFDWDYSGFAAIEAGPLAQGLRLRFAPTNPGYKRGTLSGDKKLGSGDADLRAASPALTQIAVLLGPPQPITIEPAGPPTPPEKAKPASSGGTKRAHGKK